MLAGQFTGLLCFRHSARRVWPTRWRPARGMKVTLKKQRRRDLRRAAARQEPAGGRRRAQMGPSPESR